MSTTLSPPPPPRQQIAVSPRRPDRPTFDFDRAEKIATCFFKGGITGGAATRDGILARIIAGHFLGLNETASVTGVMVQNGKPAVWGDVLMAKIRASGELVAYTEEIAGEGDAMTATVTVVRAGFEASPTVRTFSVADAKKAGLWAKGGPWQQYPRRMLPTKPRAWALRDTFADVLMGIGIREETEVPEDVPVSLPAPVSATPQVALPAATATPAVEPANPDGPVTVATLQRLAAARPAWVTALGVDPADADAVQREWNTLLFTVGVKSAREMTEAAAVQFLKLVILRTKEAAEFEPAKLAETMAAEANAAFGGDPEPSPTPDQPAISAV